MFRRVSVLVLVATLWPASAWAAYVTPTSRSTGFVVTAARWNQDVVDNMIAVRTALLDSVTNETAATDMTITATGDEIIFADQIKLLGTTSDPTNEQDVSYDSTDGCIQVNTKANARMALAGSVYAQVATVTVANTAVETTLLSSAPTIKAGGLTVGKTYRVRVQGHYSTTGTPTITIKVKFGSTALTTVSTTTESGASSAQLFIETIFTCRSTGASGTVQQQSVRQLGTAAALSMQQGITSTVTVDTTASATLDVTCTWGTASASNTCSALIATIEALN